MNTKLEQAKRIAEETIDVVAVIAIFNDELQETLRIDHTNLIYIKYLQDKLEFWENQLDVESLGDDQDCDCINGEVPARRCSH